MESKFATMSDSAPQDSVEDVLVYFATSLMKKNTIDEVLWDLASNCISKLGFIDCVIYVADYDRRVLEQHAAYGPKSPKVYEVITPIEIPFGQGITGHVLLSGESEVISDTTTDARYIVDDDARQSEITVPITIHGKVWGIIDCEHPEKGYFTHHHLRILQAVAAISAVKIERLITQQQLKEKERDLIVKEKELLELRISSLRRQVNPHFLFNALNAIQYFITSDKKREALKYYTHFSKLLRKYMLHLDEELLVLEEEVRMLDWYLRLQQFRYFERFTFHIDMEGHILNTKVNTFLFQMIAEDMIESMVMSNVGTGNLHIDFTRCDDRLCAELVFDIKGQIIQRKQSDYRSDLLHYQDHIELLNDLKDYKIQVTEVEDWGSSRHYTRKIMVSLPLNL